VHEVQGEPEGSGFAYGRTSLLHSISWGGLHKSQHKALLRYMHEEDKKPKSQVAPREIPAVCKKTNVHSESNKVLEYVSREPVDSPPTESSVSHLDKALSSLD